MAICSKFDENLLANCNDPVVGGVNDRLYLFNYDDWAGAVITRDANGIITNIVLPSGTEAITVTGQLNSNDARVQNSKTTYTQSYIHEVDFRVFDNSASVKDQVDKILKGKAVIVVQNNYKGTAGDVAFEAYGDNSGLEAIDGLLRDTADTDSGSAYTISVASNEKAKEPKPPTSVFDTDFLTTQAMLDALVTSTNA